MTGFFALWNKYFYSSKYSFIFSNTALRPSSPPIMPRTVAAPAAKKSGRAEMLLA